MKTAVPPFSAVVSGAMSRRGLGLRELCRRAELDPSFFSKVLAGKRNPPSEEEPLRRLAAALEIDAVELIVAAGRLPADWSALRSDPELLRAVHALASGRAPRRAPVARPAEPRPRREPSRPAPAAPVPAPRGLSEELL